MVHLSGYYKMHEFLSKPHSHCHLQISFADAAWLADWLFLNHCQLHNLWKLAMIEFKLTFDGQQRGFLVEEGWNSAIEFTGAH